MKKKILISLIALSQLFVSSIPVSAAPDYQISISSEYVTGDSIQLCDVISQALTDMGVKEVTSYELSRDEPNQAAIGLIMSADGVLIEATCFFSKENTWECSYVTNVYNSVEDMIYYWVSPKYSKENAYEIIDYKTGEYIIEGASQNVLSQYVNKKGWFSEDDFYLYDSQGDKINYVNSDDYMSSSDYPGSTSFRGLKIGDDVSKIFSVYNKEDFSVQVGYKDGVDTEKEDKIIQMYNSQIEATDSDDIESLLSSIDTNMVTLGVIFEGAEFCGEIIPLPQIGDKISYNKTATFGFLIDAGKISDIGVQLKSKY